MFKYASFSFLQVAGDAVSQGKSVVVDNTCPSQADRYPYIEMANDAGKNSSIYSFYPINILTIEIE